MAARAHRWRGVDHFRIEAGGLFMSRGARPRTASEVLDLFEQGRVTPAEAFALFRSIEKGQEQSMQSSAPASNLVNAARTKSKEKAEDDEEARLQRLREVEEELNALIGLDSVKELVKEVQAFVEIQQRRRKEHLVSEPLVLHMIFKGNPGTGKTTVARIFGRMFREMGVLSKGHLVECERADVVGEYIGHTAQKTRNQINQAMGGILFIDEAYALARGGEKDFGKEAIDTLVKAMEDHKDEFILILAGYHDEMEGFLQTNPGLQSRFPIHIPFPDYSPEELLQIAHHMLRERQYRLSSAARERLKKMLEEASARNDPNAGNARMVRNLIERAIRRQAVRLVKKQRSSREELMVIEEADLEEVNAV